MQGNLVVQHLAETVRMHTWLSTHPAQCLQEMHYLLLRMTSLSIMHALSGTCLEPLPVLHEAQPQGLLIHIYSQGEFL